MNQINETESTLHELKTRVARLEALQHNLPPLVPVQSKPEPTPELPEPVLIKGQWCLRVHEGNIQIGDYCTDFAEHIQDGSACITSSPNYFSGHKITSYNYVHRPIPESDLLEKDGKMWWRLPVGYPKKEGDGYFRDKSFIPWNEEFWGRPVEDADYRSNSPTYRPISDLLEVDLDKPETYTIKNSSLTESITLDFIGELLDIKFNYDFFAPAKFFTHDIIAHFTAKIKQALTKE